MNLVLQGSILDLIAASGPLTERLTRQYTAQVLEGLQYLHEQKIIHRDIKGMSRVTQVCSETFQVPVMLCL